MVKKKHKRRKKRRGFWLWLGSWFGEMLLALACVFVIREFRNLSNDFVLIFIASAAIFMGITMRSFPLGRGRFERRMGLWMAMAGIGLLVMVAGWLLGWWPIAILE